MRTAVVLASVLLVVGALAVWVSRTVLDTPTWADTSARVLQNPTVQKTLSAYLVDQIYDNVDVETELRNALPARAAPLAAPAAAGLRQFSDTAVQRALDRPRVQDAWVQANALANRQVQRLLDGGGSALSTTNGEVVLDLHGLLQSLQSSTGVGGRAAAVLPADSGRIVLLRSNQLKTAQTVTQGLKVSATVVVLIVLALFAAAVWLAPDRRRAVRNCAIGMLAAALVLILVRRVLGDQLLDHVVRDDSVRPAAHEVWWIATDQLRLITTSLVAVGIVGLLGAWVAGPGENAVATRRFLAPYLREPAVAYGALAAICLLLLAWAPTPAARTPVTAISLIVLAALGIEVLRRQAAREFPDAQRGQLDLSRIRRAPAPATPTGDPRLERLARLGELHRQGVLSDEEFGREKARVLGAAEAPAAPASPPAARRGAEASARR
jgi:hypothetical protein